MIRVSVTENFEKALKKLPPHRAKAAVKSLQTLMVQPSAPSLKLRRFEALDSYWLINAHHGDRLILRRESDDLFSAVDVGPHDNILRKWNRR